MGETITANGTEFWVERRGEGPDVLLIAALTDPARRGSSSSTGSATTAGAPRTATAGRDARRCRTSP